MAEIGIMKRFLAELIGTFALVFIGIGYGGLGDWLAIGLAFGFIIMCIGLLFFGCSSSRKQGHP